MRKTSMPDTSATLRISPPRFSAFTHWRELCGIGLFIVWHWQMLNVFRYAKEEAFPGEVGDAVYLFFFASLLFTAFFLSGRRAGAATTRNGHGWLASAATLCILSLLFTLFPSPPPGTEKAGLIALAVSGAGSAILCLLWLRSLAKAPYRDTITVIGGGFVLATALTSLASPYPDAAIAISVFSIILSRFLLPYPQTPDEGGEEEKKRVRLPASEQVDPREEPSVLLTAACGSSFGAGAFYSLVIFLRPMGEPSPLTLSLLFGAGALLAVVFLKLSLEKDIYQALLLMVPFLLCGYAAWPILHGESPGLSLVGMRLGYGLLAVYLFVSVSALAAQTERKGRDVLCACLGAMCFSFWLGTHLSSLHLFNAYDAQELDLVFIALLVVLLGSCGACVYWLHQVRHATQSREKAAQEDALLLDYLMDQGLTQQQAVIAALISKKISEERICALLDITPLTLETHIRNIHKRMGINSRHELLWISRISRRRGAKAGESPSGPSLTPEETAKPDR